jgi:uncharacterized membrane protein YkvA (DUF1232 family)
LRMSPFEAICGADHSEPREGQMWFQQPSGAWPDVEALAQRMSSDDEAVWRTFWRKLQRLAASLPFAEDLLAAHYCAFDHQTPLHVRGALMFALAYFVLPLDFIPDYLPVIGYTDDAAVLAATIKLVTTHITPDHRAAAQRMLARMRGEQPSRA